MQSAKAITARHSVDGLDQQLAYRSKECVPALMQAVCAAVSKPVIVAGSTHMPQQIGAVKDAGAAVLTAGIAALDGGYSGYRSGSAPVAKFRCNVNGFRPRHAACGRNTAGERNRARL